MHYDQRNVKKTPEEHFHHFQQRFQRQYESDAEHKHRLQVFKVCRTEFECFDCF